MMGNYSAYASYKDSGVEWLGQIPEHWGVKRLKNISSCNDEILTETTNSDYEMEYVDISSVNLISGITNHENLTFEKAPSRARRKVKDGDTIISTVRTYLKAIAAIKSPPDNLIVSTGFAVIRPKENVNPDFIGYLLQTEGFVGKVVANSVGVSYPAINSSTLTSLPVLEPPLDEQKAIAAFLDYKTQQIDQLIAKKEALLEKLDEKRTALISHAVTKGLDPTVPMKDSGVEWLGEIPEHWKRIPFRWCCSITEGQVDPTKLKFKDLTLIAPNHIESHTGRIIAKENAYDQGAISGKYFYQAGSLLYSKIRPALVKACIAEEDGLCSADMYPINTFNNLLSKFMLYQILSKSFTQLAILVSDRVAMPKVNREKLGSFPILVPDPKEQEKIIEYLDQKTTEIDRQKSKILQAIDLLKEYPSSAEVCGDEKGGDDDR